ncbi:MAG TPA: hypothetical protein VFC78_22815 [Tepidisphaeraceae bacterium]|nr:hypothetical protein [Tepidisphaeraceae bacterium]
MDKELVELMSAMKPGDEANPKEGRSFTVNLETGVATIELEGETRLYPFKPLNVLFGNGHGVDSIDVFKDLFKPLLLTIEEAILIHARHDPSLTDGEVSLVLEQLSMDPCAMGDDPLAGAIRLNLRMLLSLNDYSRQEVKMAIRKIAKSVQRHTRTGGPRGYLQFIATTLRTRS